MSTNWITIVPARPEHGEAIAPYLRAEDRIEAEHTGMSAAAAIAWAIGRSFESWAAFDVLGYAIAVWGIGAPTLTGNVAWPWLMTTDLVLKHKTRFLREARDFVARQSAIYPVLQVQTLADYRGALRLLAWLGFRGDLGRPASEPFLLMERNA